MLARRQSVLVWRWSLLLFGCCLGCGQRREGLQDAPLHQGVVINADNGNLEEMDVSPDGKVVACFNSGGPGGAESVRLSLWDVSKATKLVSFSEPGISLVEFWPNKQFLAISLRTSNTIELRSVPELKVKVSLEGHSDAPYIFRFTPDGKTLVSLSATELIAWDVAARKPKRRVEHGLTLLEAQVAVLREGKLVVLAGHKGKVNGVVSCRDMTTGKEVWTFRAHKHPREPDHFGVTALAGSPDGLTFATSGLDGAIRIWDPAKKKEIVTIPDVIQKTGVFRIAYSPDGKVLAGPVEAHFGDPGGVIFWDSATGKQLAIRKTRGSMPRFLHFLPDGKHLLVGIEGIRGFVELWDLKTILPAKP